MNELVGRVWHALGPLQGRLAYGLNAKFAVGVCGIVRAGDGRVLLLRHRLWPDDGQWGFPSGFAKRGEQFADTIVREVREETGLTITVGRLVEVRNADKYRAEVYYEATLAGDLAGLVLEDREILEAGLFRLDDLPGAMPPLHREFARRGARSA
jgi:8-oxo-dGTP diphosphatase